MYNTEPSWTCLYVLDIKWGIVVAYTSPCVALTYLSWNPHYSGNVASCHVWEGFSSCRINSDTLLVSGLWAKDRPFYFNMIFFYLFFSAEMSALVCMRGWDSHWVGEKKPASGTAMSCHAWDYFLSPGDCFCYILILYESVIVWCRSRSALQSPWKRKRWVSELGMSGSISLIQKSEKQVPQRLKHPSDNSRSSLSRWSVLLSIVFAKTKSLVSLFFPGDLK